jgi:excisionase family DNA binding protein
MLTNARRSQLLTVKETASRLGYHPRTVRRKIERGEIPAVQLGGKGSAVRVDERDLDRWLYQDPAQAAGIPAERTAPASPSSLGRPVEAVPPAGRGRK